MTLVRKALTIVLFLMIPAFSGAQSLRENSAMKSLRKQRWEKAHAQLSRLLAKDSFSVPALYLLGRFYYEPENPSYHLDSAYNYTVKSLHVWKFTEPRSKQKLKKFPLDSARLVSLRRSIDSSAFVIARTSDTEEAYSRFIKSFPFSSDIGKASRLRHNAAFKTASEKNTFQSYLVFMEKYPEAAQMEEAKSKYDLLLFEFYTRDRKLESFEKFVKENPSSPYRYLAERNIFQLTTLPGTMQSFQDFMVRYPKSMYTSRAADMLYHILVENHQENAYPVPYLSDSLATAISLKKIFLTPFLTNGKFGFMNASGKEMIPPLYDEIPEEYTCGDISEEFIVLDERIHTLNGKLIYDVPVNGVSDIGYGFLLVEEGKEGRLIHKTGFRFSDKAVKDARLPGGRIVSLREGDAWKLYSLSGLSLSNESWDEITSVGEVVILQKNKQFRLATIQQLTTVSNGSDPVYSEAYDEVKKVSDDLIMVRKGNLYGIVNQQLKSILKPDSVIINPVFFGVTVSKDSVITTINKFGETSENFMNLEVREPWVAAKTASGWVLYDPVQRIYKSIPYDSVSVYGPFAVGNKKNGLEIHFHAKPNLTIHLPKAGRMEFIPGNDSTSYLLVENSKKMTVYNARGNSLFTIPSVDRLQYAGQGHFQVIKKEKKGLINQNGKTIVPAEYDAIGNVSNGVISILRGMKFGFYDLKTKKLVKPEYDKNIVPFFDNVFVAFKGGSSGFIDSGNKPLSEFVYSEIRPWSDSVALVKRNDLWSLYHVYKKQELFGGIASFKIIRDEPEDKLFIIKKENQLGVISNTRGQVLPVNFSDIVNVGSDEIPVYFTEKHVEEASIFVVIYYDSAGTMLRKEVYEQEDYERIYCNP